MPSSDDKWHPPSPVLVVAAHPDDEVLGCGGTIALVAATQPVYIAILGEGVSSRYDRRADADPMLIERLRGQSRDVATSMGVKEVVLFGFPDNRFDGIALLDIVKRIEKLLADIAPRTIFTHHPGDLNIDHAITFRAVLTASRPLPGAVLRDLYTFEVPSSTEWAFQRFGPAFRPNVFIDISTTIDQKVGAMEQYEGERRLFPHPRSSEALRASAQRWGSVVGLEYAEPFELVRSLR